MCIEHRLGMVNGPGRQRQPHNVREPDDVAALAFDAPDVINLPLSQLAQHWQQLPQDHELITVCFNGDL